MKAYVLESIGNLQYKEVPEPECPEGWAIIEVKAAGICSSDIPRIFTKGTYHFPTIPGHEFSGVVKRTGSKTDESWIGKRVGVFPLIPCKECEQCRKKKFELCSNYDYTGSRRDGGFAEEVAVPVWNLIEIPDMVPFEEAALFEPLAVALHAAKRLGVKKGDHVGIIGTGMIGIAVAQWAKAFGAEYVAIIGRTEEKRTIIEALSGISYFTYNDELPQFDRTIEAVGTPNAIAKAIDLTKPEGNIVFMGNPSGDILLEQNNYWKILRNQLHISGTWNSSFDGMNPSDWTEVTNAIASGNINLKGLISHRYSKEQLFDGLSLIKEHKEPYCKVMTKWE